MKAKLEDKGKPNYVNIYPETRALLNKVKGLIFSLNEDIIALSNDTVIKIALTRYYDSLTKGRKHQDFINEEINKDESNPRTDQPNSANPSPTTGGSGSEESGKSGGTI
jgi:hypothetical protein